QNRFAGRQNTPLTDLGVRQAHQAGAAVAALGIRFDEVHTSTLDRARLTAAVIIGHLAEDPATRVEKHALDERDFGVFTAANKSLVKKAVGFRGYTECFHSTTGTPPGGESWEELRERVRRYYIEVLLPASREGKRVLVVTHKYVVEMFAVVLADLHDYRDMKIPNARPLSEEDLRRIAAAPAVAAKINDLGEHVEIRLPALLAGSCVLGAFLQFVLRSPLPAAVLSTAITTLLMCSTFFGMLRLQPRTLRVTTGLGRLVAGTVLKSAAGAALLFTTDSVPLLLLGLALLVPPATLAPVLALLWGGDFHASVRHTLAASLVTPAVLLLVAATQHDPLPRGLVAASAVVLLCAVTLPTLVAQRLRHRDPITAGRLTTNWNWLGSAALIPLAGLTGYALTPSTSLPSELIPFGLAEVALVVAAFALPRVLVGVLETRRHLYVTQGTPNVFLWLTVGAPLVARAGVLVKLLPALTAGVFFAALVLDEHIFVRMFRRRLATAR
ncbi:MAG: ribonuclease / adenosylcobalamin/alpha-ribazole phosphatase, partial [Pseudonocardiales bacterium]|nr:ribonuclease / adenosylcobalamin/alpha-ribazole phosphatase [Pseudonocardiales bacterium]